jgi:HAD superfamily hydrolase (TIGR01509 family)
VPNAAEPPAVLFDVDGTLVDTNWFHTVSWWRAFQKAGEDTGEDVAMSRIHPLIGMGSDQLLATLFGEQRADLKEAHGDEFAVFRKEIHAFPRAGDLLRAVHGRGGRVVLCTSSKADDLGPMLKAIDADDAIDDVVNADDVEQSKPAPDVFAAGLDKLGLDAERCIVVGDTRWDIEAAGKLGLQTVSVLTGGSTREQLQEWGAVAVYEDAADQLAHRGESPVGKLIGG